MYIQESDIMEAILAEIDRYVKAYEAIDLTYSRRKAELDARTERLKTKIQALQEEIRCRYDNFVMTREGSDYLQKVQKEKETVQTELWEVESQIVTLNKGNEKYKLFRGVLQNKQEIKKLISSHLKTVILYAAKHIEVRFV